MHLGSDFRAEQAEHKPSPSPTQPRTPPEQWTAQCPEAAPNKLSEAIFRAAAIFFDVHKQSELQASRPAIESKTSKYWQEILSGANRSAVSRAATDIAALFSGSLTNFSRALASKSGASLAR